MINLSININNNKLCRFVDDDYFDDDDDNDNE